MISELFLFKLSPGGEVPLQRSVELELLGALRTMEGLKL